jgi:hypothetical protein
MAGLGATLSLSKYTENRPVNDNVPFTMGTIP